MANNPAVKVEAHPEVLKMLIADDDPAAARLLAERCTRMGFQVEIATNGIQLIIKARRNPPDILITDVNMPELDGLSACVRLLDPGSKHIEIVVITGSPNPETVDRSESVGTHYLRKGPDFWKDMEIALSEIYPFMATTIKGEIRRSSSQVMQHRPRLLLVDDDQMVETFLSTRFGKYGVDTLYASTANEAYQIACKHEPSVMVIDNFMPDGDALYLLQRLRSSTMTASIPVIVLSGQKLDDVTEQNLRREIYGHPGAAYIIRKSFDTDELFSAVKRYCGFEPNRVEN
jgi:CheY-like chemotaxis protein